LQDEVERINLQSQRGFLVELMIRNKGKDTHIIEIRLELENSEKPLIPKEHKPKELYPSSGEYYFPNFRIEKFFKKGKSHKYVLFFLGDDAKELLNDNSREEHKGKIYVNDTYKEYTIEVNFNHTDGMFY